AGRHFVGAGQVEIRGQERPLFDRPGLHDLRHRAGGHGRVLAVADAGVHVGQGAVRRSQVDAQHVARRWHVQTSRVKGQGCNTSSLYCGGGGSCQGSSTSAGMRTNSSWPSGGGASFSSRTRQPWCRSVPRKGGVPVTLPVSRTAEGSNPGGTSTWAPSPCGM